MVKIPELTEDGQNWKIYCAKFLEVAATFDCLEVLAGRPYKGDDWDGCNALLCCVFMETVAPSIYFKIRRRTVHENFKYLVKHFCNNDPIPCANELQCAGTATAAEMPENYPMSVNAATEQHAHANSDVEDLSNSTTKDLTQGTEDIDDRNVGHIQDPCMSLEALAQGTSAKCAETTPVILESMLHEMQTEPHSSLPLTPRLPIEGEPRRCKQEVVESIVTAGHTNGMVKTANLPETIADIDRTAPLGGKPVERARGVDEGDGTEHEPQSQLQQTIFYSKEDQCNANPNRDIPFANGLPLEGERTVNLSGKRDTSVHASIDEAEGDPGREVEPADVPNELDMLIVLSIELESMGDGEIPHVYLRGMSWRPCNVEGLGC